MSDDCLCGCAFEQHIDVYGDMSGCFNCDRCKAYTTDAVEARFDVQQLND